MALQELNEYEDDYVFLSDVDSDVDYTLNIPRVASLNSTAGSALRKSFLGHIDTDATSATGISPTSLSSSSRNSQQQQGQRQAQERGSQHSSPEDEEEDDSDMDDIEEIEYGYDTDILLIMPAMLRDYSHHATNYHPELWRSPIPGSYSPKPSSARFRQEDRMLDRQEMLKNSIPPTTCGICFDSFTTFDLSPLQLQDAQKASEITSRAHFAMSFTARLARSFASKSSNDSNSSVQASVSSTPTSPVTSPTEEQTSSASSAPTDVDEASSSSNRRRSLAPTITPSLSSKEIGIVMPCNHGLCLSCLQSFLTNAAQNPQARFPTLCPQPGCRTPVPTESAELVLDSETLEVWYRKLAEIHVANKVCCPKPECRSVIDLDDRDGTAVTCPECKSSFCASCAVPFHRGMTCEQYQAQTQGSNSEEDRAMLQLVQDRHWRHCPSCRFVIEKQQGCNHMVCHCGQSFCYACGNPWNEEDARCSRDCESYGVHEDIGLDCIIM